MTPYTIFQSLEFIAVYATIRDILHTSGRAKSIEKFLRDLSENSNMLARDGTTDIGSLLYVSKLSMLSSASNPTQAKDESTKARQRPTPASLPRTEELTHRPPRATLQVAYVG